MQKSYLIEIAEEADGRFLAEVVDLPGVMVHADTAEAALARAQALAFRVLEDRLDHDGGRAGPVSVTFATVPAGAKLSALRTESYFAERAARADIPRALDILERAGSGNPPVEGDDLPG